MPRPPPRPAATSRALAVCLLAAIGAWPLGARAWPKDPEAILAYKEDTEAVMAMLDVKPRTPAALSAGAKLP